MKPLKGVDDGLRENLESLIHQDYPVFEIILGARDADDPALQVARDLARDYPQAPIRVVVCDRPLGLNPKVANLSNLSGHAQYEYVLVSDSNVRVDPNYLRAIASEFANPRVGLVSNVIIGVGERRLGSRLENLHMNSFVAGAVCGADVMAGHSCVVGKSMLFRLRDLDAVGGWWDVRNVLAEDYVLGRKFADSGLEVVVSGHPIRSYNRNWNLRQFLARQMRWCQLRRWVSPRAYVFEPLLNPIPFLVAAGVMAPLAVSGPLGWLLTAVTSLGVGLKVTSDALLDRRLRGRLPGVDVAFWIPFKDLAFFAIWAISIVHRTVNWRGNLFHVGPGSTLQPHRPEIVFPELDAVQVPVVSAPHAAREA